MLVYLYDNQSGTVNEFIKFEFDGSYFRTFLNENEVSTIEASFGDCIYITPQGQKKAPIVEKAALPQNRGARIAWALSFIGKEKFAKTEKDFFEKIRVHFDDVKLRNLAYEYSQNNFGFLIADKAILYKKTYKLKKASTILAWISDDISDEALEDLCRRYSKTRKIYCPLEYLKKL